MHEITSLAEHVLAGDERATAQAISLVEDGTPQREELLIRLFPHTGRAFVIGVTGPPGSGKSTLVDRMIRGRRDQGLRVAVIAVDPSSPFSQGAILGDRIRMQSHAEDPNVFIRSMASRGHLGGVSSATFDTVKILDAAGYDYIFIETIGVGQSEVEVVDLSDLILLVLIPGTGDDIQAMKAGVMEIGDLYIINKMDLEGADKLKTEVEYVLGLQNGREMDTPPVVMVSGKTGEGVNALISTIDSRLDEMKDSSALESRRKENIAKELEILIASKVKKTIEDKFAISECLECWAEEIYTRDADPYSMIRENITSKLEGDEAT